MKKLIGLSAISLMLAAGLARAEITDADIYSAEGDDGWLEQVSTEKVEFAKLVEGKSDDFDFHGSNYSD